MNHELKEKALEGRNGLPSETETGDLFSDDVLLREAAINQLEVNFADKSALELLKKLLQRETNPALAISLQALINRFDNGEGSAGAKQSRGEPLEDFCEQWLNGTLEARQSLFTRLQRLSADAQHEIISELITRVDQVDLLIPLVTQSLAAMKNRELLALLPPFLNNNGNGQLMLRILQILHLFAPDLAVKQLPELLKYPDHNIKIICLRILHKLFPQEAIRLLENLMLSQSSQKTFGDFLFLVFPFNQVFPLILRLIDAGIIDEQTIKVVKHLAANNPNINFFKHLNIISLKNPNNPQLIQELKELAAGVIVKAGLTSESQESLMEKALAAARSLLGLPEVAVVAEEPQEISELKLSDNLSQDDRQKLDLIFSDPAQKNLRIQILKDLPRFPVLLQAYKDRIASCIEDSDHRLAVKAMLLLADHAPQKLIPHLPVLAFSESPIVSSQALRLWQKLSVESLKRMTVQWVNKGSEKDWAVARSALLLLSSDFSANLLLKSFAKTQSPALIDYFGPVFLTFPGLMLLYEIEKLEVASRGAKKASLAVISNKLKDELGNIPIIETNAIGRKILEVSGLKDQAENYLRRLKMIDFRLREADFSRLRPHWAVFFAVLLTVIFSTLWFKSTFKTNDKSAGRKAGPSTTISREETERPAVGQKLRVIAEQKEFLSDRWQVKTESGSSFKVDLGSNDSMKKGQVYTIEVQDSHQSSSGLIILKAAIISD